MAFNQSIGTESSGDSDQSPASTAFVQQEIAANVTPAGAVMDFAGSSAPTGWFLCDGSTKDTTAEAALFAVIGYTYGGSGSSFNLPDYTGKVLVALDSGQTEFDALTDTGGAKTHALTAAETATKNHTHSGTTGTVSSNHYHTPAAGTYLSSTSGTVVSLGSGSSGRIINSTYAANTNTFSANHTHNFTSGNPNGGEADGSAHNNLQPYAVANKIIKA